MRQPEWLVIVVYARVLAGVDRLARRQVRVGLVLVIPQERVVRPRVWFSHRARVNRTAAGQLAEPGEPPAVS
jgi:hypothetical protein